MNDADQKLKIQEYRDRHDRVWLSYNPPVFFSSVVLITLLVVVCLISLTAVAESINAIQAWIANQTGWFFVLCVNLILAYLIYLVFSPAGNIRLGGKQANPQFSRFGWFAMLFSAGMGIGLMFYSVAEPVFHLITPPHGANPYSVRAYEDAISTTFLHWGLHAWGIYALTGLAIAYFAYNRKQAFSIRSIFQPVLGDRIYGFYGHAIDVIATVATLFGVATSLGLGVSQINAGLDHLFGIPVSSLTQILLITGITAVATLSVVLGLDRGIQNLSRFNIFVAILLLLFVFIIGPSLFILNGFVENLGLYLDRFFYLAFWNETYTGGDWQNGWTVFYWGWWIAWSPFVGMFVARISYGRTIREFIFAVLVVATLMTFIWLSVFGNAALFVEINQAGELVGAVQKNVASSLFVFFEKLPVVVGYENFPDILLKTAGAFATVVIISFFVTSSDSGSLVIDMITAGGHANPPVVQRVFWSITEGLVAAILLIAGGLTALQTAAISVGLPFALLIIFIIVNLQKALNSDESDNQFTAPVSPDL